MALRDELIAYGFNASAVRLDALIGFLAGQKLCCLGDLCSRQVSLSVAVHTGTCPWRNCEACQEFKIYAGQQSCQLRM